MAHHTNVFLVINLGCEMLYVIDQRLKAQCITVERSGQVLRDLTCVLLDPKLLDQLMLGPPSPASADQPHPNQSSPSRAANARPPSAPAQAPLLNHHLCRRLLADIACCSLMRLDPGSMDKLWDLTVMVLKWQLTLLGERCSAGPEPATQPLLDLTFRHMDGIARLLPETRKTTLVDCTKRHLIELWDGMLVAERQQLLAALGQWLQPFGVKISLLMRLGFQRPDATFETSVDSDFYRYYADHVGENIYTKHAYVTSVGGRRKGAARNRLRMPATATATVSGEEAERSREIDALAAQLSVATLEAGGRTGLATGSPCRRGQGRRGQRGADHDSRAEPDASHGSSSTSSPRPLAKRNGSGSNALSDADGCSLGSPGTEDFAGDNCILDEVTFDLDAYNRKRRADLRMAGETIVTIDSRDSEFEHVQRTVASLDAIIDRFSLDFFRPLGDVGIIEELDCTRELLRLLDEG